MSDPRTLPVRTDARTDLRTGGTRPRRATWLWVLLVVAVVVDLVSSAGVLPPAVGTGSGAVAIGCIAALVVARVRR
ncbi:hypothetical protein [Kineococcus sp. SYSU DK006]|uniref:hypothetical protein n=1 Tax=Kineococcus sp. SYSU DK006 TaxID=3383127 RepID=UPI003D7D4796